MIRGLPGPPHRSDYNQAGKAAPEVVIKMVPVRIGRKAKPVLPSSGLNLYRILNWPPVYTVSQFLLAPGAQLLMTRRLRAIARRVPAGRRILDVGCGPASWLFRIGLDPVGLDYEPEYINKYHHSGHIGVVASADRLPFASQSFDSVWTVGVLHHLNDDSVREAVREMLRVCCVGGAVIILDAVMPKSAYTRPIAYLLRRLDRGRFIRSEHRLFALLSEVASFPEGLRRFTFALTGLEGVECSISAGQSQ